MSWSHWTSVVIGGALAFVLRFLFRKAKKVAIEETAMTEEAFGTIVAPV